MKTWEIKSRDTYCRATFRLVSGNHQGSSEFPFRKKWYQLAHYWQCFSQCPFLIYFPNFRSLHLFVNIFPFVELCEVSVNPFPQPAVGHQNGSTSRPPSSLPLQAGQGGTVSSPTSLMKVFYSTGSSIWGALSVWRILCSVLPRSITLTLKVATRADNSTQLRKSEKLQLRVLVYAAHQCCGIGWYGI